MKKQHSKITQKHLSNLSSPICLLRSSSFTSSHAYQADEIIQPKGGHSSDRWQPLWDLDHNLKHSEIIQHTWTTTTRSSNVGGWHLLVMRLREELVGVDGKVKFGWVELIGPGRGLGAQVRLECVGPNFFSLLGWKHNWVLGAKWAKWYISSLLGDRKWIMEWWVMDD